MGALRLILALALALVALAGCTGGVRGTDGGQETETHVVVARVSDGDSLRLVGGKRVRLVQIDAPELEGDCFGDAARRALLELAPPGTRVSLVRDPALDDRDDYGRLLRYVVVAGVVVNVELVRAGAASPYFFRGERGRHARALLDAAASARRARRGFWGACPRARFDPTRGAQTGPG